MLNRVNIDENGCISATQQLLLRDEHGSSLLFLCASQQASPIGKYLVHSASGSQLIEKGERANISEAGRV